jgi:hypothetical protein
VIFALRQAEPDAFARALAQGVPARPANMDHVIARNKGWS